MKGLILMLITTIPMVAYAGDGDATPIPWSTIITLVLVSLTAVAGGVIGAMRRALVASHEALRIVSAALEDSVISDDEIKAIVKASINCHESYKDLIKRLGDLVKKNYKV